MRRLIPHFIQEQYKQGNEQGQFLAATMFVDLSGFTRMTETLMQRGEEGAEIMSNILNDIFNPLVNNIYKHGGFITTFAGDAFTAMFPDEHNIHPLNLFQCARKCQAQMNRRGLQQTKFGDFTISAKVGLSHGAVEWGIVGSEEYNSYYFRGAGVDGCAEAEHHAETGDIVFDAKMRGLIVNEAIAFDDLGNGFFRLTTIPSDDDIPKPKSMRRGRLSRKIVDHFLPDTVIDFAHMGEFRNAVSVFVSFDGLKTKKELDIFVNELIINSIRYGGFFNRVDFGDKGGVILCIFGAPTAYEDNIERALDFVLYMKKSVEEQPELANLKMRIGVTYGMVYAGIIGGDKRCEYTVIGDVVNLSARFMMKADFGQVWVSDVVYRYALEFYDFEFGGKHAFKGKSDEIPTYLLKTKKQHLQQTYSGKFVGRSNEMSEIGDAFAPLHNQQTGGLVYVYGEAGVGKSRLVYEVKRAHPEMNWLYLPCDGIQRQSFNPFRRVFTLYFQQDGESSRAENKARFESIYQKLIDTASNEHVKKELERLKTIMAGFLNIYYEASLYEQMDAKLRYENTLYAFKEVFKALSLTRPLVLEIEDIQWIDPDSQNAIEVLGRNIDDFSIILLATSRYYDDKSKPRLNVELPVLEIDLNTLTPEGLVEMAEEILQGSLSMNLMQNLQYKTDGNPFFIEQTVAYYQESRIIEYDPDQESWVMVKDEDAIPATINDLIISRIDRLSEKLKEAVQTAAVLGQEFEVRLLHELLRETGNNWPTDELQDQLEAGEGNRVWSILAEIKGIFAHTLMHDVVYRMQLRSRLRHLHKLVGEILEKYFLDQKNVYGDLAFHYERAEITEKAIEYLKKAADQDKNEYHNERAIDLYERLLKQIGIQLDSTDPELNDVEITDKNRKWFELCQSAVIRLSSVSRDIGQIQKAIETAQFATKLAERIQDDQRRAWAHGLSGTLAFYQGKYSEAMQLYQKQLLMSKMITDDNETSYALDNIAILKTVEGDFQAAIQYLEEEIEICQKIDSRVGFARAYSNLGVVYDLKGELDQAMEFYQKQFQISEADNNRADIAIALGNIGILHYLQGQYDQAIDFYQKKLDISYELGIKREIGIAIGNMGVAYEELGNYKEAMACYERKLFISEELGEKNEIAMVCVNIGNVYRAQKQFDKANLYYDRAIQIGEKNAYNFDLIEFYCEKATALFQEEKYSLANEINEKAHDLASKVKRFDFNFRIKLLNAKLAATAGKIESAMTALTEMLQHAALDEEKAALFFEMWKIKKEPFHFETAKRLYNELLQKTPKIEYRNNLEILKKS